MGAQAWFSQAGRIGTDGDDRANDSRGATHRPVRPSASDDVDNDSDEDEQRESDDIDNFSDEDEHKDSKNQDEDGKDGRDDGDDKMRDSGDEDERDKEAGYEARKPRVVANPTTPSRQEKEEHEVTHCPYRSWCPNCVRGRGVSSPHRRGKEKEERAVPMVAADYGHLTAMADPGKPHMLVIRSARCGCTFATIVPQKGPSEDWLVKACTAWIDSLGLKRIILRTDQEVSIEAWAAEVRRRRMEETVLETSPVEEKQANGVAEKAVREVKGMIRTYVDSIEEKAKVKLEGSDAIMTWIVRHAAAMITRFQVGTDGKTPYERMKGKRTKRPLAAIGEKILYMKKDGKGMNMRFDYGFFLGVSEKSDELYVATEAGVLKTRTVRRLTDEKKWDGDFIKRIVGTPWAPIDGRSPMHIGARIHRQDVPEEHVPEEANPTVQTKRFRITREDLRKYGYTPGCAGCRSAQIPGYRAVAHTEKCRSRITEEMSKEPAGAEKIEKSRLRIEEAVARRLEQEDEDRRKKKARTEQESSQSKRDETTASSSNNGNNISDEGGATEKQEGQNGEQQEQHQQQQQQEEHQEKSNDKREDDENEDDINDRKRLQERDGDNEDDFIRKKRRTDDDDVLAEVMDLTRGTRHGRA